MFGTTIQNFKLSIMTPQEQYNFYMADADRLGALLRTERDPAKIQQYAAAINQDVNNAFNLMSDSEKRANIDAFILRINALNDAIGVNIDTESTGISNSITTTLESVNTTLTTFVSKMATAGDKISEGAEIISHPPRTQVDVDITVRDDRVEATSEVGTGEGGRGGRGG